MRPALQTSLHKLHQGQLSRAAPASSCHENQRKLDFLRDKLWRAVDHESEVLENYVTKKQTQKSSFKVYEESHAALWISQLDRY